MFTLDLAQIKRAGAETVQGEIPTDDPVWKEVDATPEGPLRVELTARFTATGQLLVSGKIGGVLRQGCRRCLEEVRIPLEEELDLVWEERDEEGEAEVSDDDEIRLLDPAAGELEVDEALRAELLLRTPRWSLCRKDCRGLCPHCGINRNTDNCDCSVEEADPRWAALRGLKLDDERK
jgi:uncharacterized protein